MKDLIIFGRSPFINKLDVNKIDYNRFDVCCINQPIPNAKKIHYLVSVDTYTKPKLTPDIEWISVHTGWRLPKSITPILRGDKINWVEYSSSAAVNFAIIRGYKNIYLAGVDLPLDGVPFLHYDGSVAYQAHKPNGARVEREYIKKVCDLNNVNIYQTNPEITDWLDIADIGLCREVY